MKKFLIYITILAISLYGFLTCTMNSLKASEYNTAVIGHVITQKVTGQSIDASKLMEQELARIAHLFALDSINILQKYLPAILDKAAAELRLEADKNYKCSLLKDTKIQDDCK
jgi:predicted thioredoxin/glutaredoxin